MSGGDVERRRADVLSVHLAARQLPVLDVLPFDDARPTTALPQHRLQRHADQRRGDRCFFHHIAVLCLLP